jgi:hypothetical protein
MKLFVKAISVLFLIFSTCVNAENVWLRAFPSSYDLALNQHLNAKANFKFKMFNPYNEPKRFSYKATLCAQENEHYCTNITTNKLVQSKEWWTGNFDLYTYIIYKYRGTFELKARIEADGSEHVEHERHGVISVY